MPGEHGVTSHSVQMIGIGGAIFIALLLTGRPTSEALYLAVALSCPVMMIGMMVTMRGPPRRNLSTTTPTRPSRR